MVFSEILAFIEKSDFKTHKCMGGCSLDFLLFRNILIQIWKRKNYMSS